MDCLQIRHPSSIDRASPTVSGWTGGLWKCFYTLLWCQQVCYVGFAPIPQLWRWQASSKPQTACKNGQVRGRHSTLFVNLFLRILSSLIFRLRQSCESQSFTKETYHLLVKLSCPFAVLAKLWMPYFWALWLLLHLQSWVVIFVLLICRRFQKQLRDSQKLQQKASCQLFSPPLHHSLKRMAMLNPIQLQTFWLVSWRPCLAKSTCFG